MGASIYMMDEMDKTVEAAKGGGRMDAEEGKDCHEAHPLRSQTGGTDAEEGGLDLACNALACENITRNDLVYLFHTIYHNYSM